MRLEKAVRLNPYYSSSRINLDCTIAFFGSHDEGLALVKNAFRIGPRLACDCVKPNVLSSAEPGFSKLRTALTSKTWEFVFFG
jgi:hypothetical protein